MNPSPLGAIVGTEGTTFRVWAPHAEAVSVIGSFPDGAAGVPLSAIGEGIWEGIVPKANAGDRYKFHLRTPFGEFDKIDPYAREVTSSVGEGVIHDPAFDWGEDAIRIAAWNELVIYELHVGTFFDADPTTDVPATFDNIASKFDHLKRLGVNALQLMPIAEFAGDRSWGYNPAHINAVEQAYGGPKGFKQFVKAAHQHGFAVILDVVYNHFGPSDLDLWRFDGWSENGGGGIYFYNDYRRTTPWGDTRPDYGRPEVRRFILDNVRMWLDEYHLDGLRLDATAFIRKLSGEEQDESIVDGWRLLQAINRVAAEEFPHRIIISEDIKSNEWITKPISEGGAGFGSQWDPRFVYPVRDQLKTPDDMNRSMVAIREALSARYNADHTQRVVYTESHDEVANGKSRVPTEIDPANPTGWYAQKRSILGAACAFTSLGIPMVFQGQEFLEAGHFQDTVPVDWDQREDFRGLVRLYRDLIRLRLNRAGTTKGLTGQNIDVYHTNDDANVIAYARWEQGGPKDTTIAILNFSSDARANYRIGLPGPGIWKLRLNSDWQGYSQLFGNHASADLVADGPAYDDRPVSGNISIGPYSVLIYSQDA